MNTSSILAFCIGVIAGLRSLIAPAVVCWAAHFGWINLHGSRLSFMAATATAVIFNILALVELATDKHPDAPIRTTLGLLTVRVALGALSGAALRRESFVRARRDWGDFWSVWRAWSSRQNRSSAALAGRLDRAT